MNETTFLCRAVIGSVTHATRAQHVLASAAIRTEVVKIREGERSGCVYGIELPSAQRKNAEEILSFHRIRVRSWVNTHDA